jgi:hypothetical protein
VILGHLRRHPLAVRLNRDTRCGRVAVPAADRRRHACLVVEVLQRLPEVQLPEDRAVGRIVVVDVGVADRELKTGLQVVAAVSGLVADLIGTKVVRVRQDDAEGYEGMIEEASIYPTSVRSTALNDINSAGPGWLSSLAAKEVGCPAGLHE